ncbi:MAG: ATP-binding cassette domain-containing protein [Gammaproteobacteria bacterium]|nr:ATP-binding cassette domain-containing protein [Gammaproteobacteria bacterium]
MANSNTTETRGPLKRLLGYALHDKKRLWQALLLLLIATAADVTAPLLIKVFLDDYVVPGNWQMDAIIWIGIAYIFFMLLAATTNYMQAVRLNVIAQGAVQTLREQVFARVMRLPLSHFDHTPTGSMVSRMTNDTESIKELYVNVVGSFIQNMMRILGVIIAMAILDWQLMIICLLFVPVVAFLMWLYQRISAPLFHRARGLLSDINAKLHESIQGMRVVQLNGQQPRFRRDFSSLAEEHYQARRRNAHLDAWLLRPLVDLLQKLILAGLLFTFAYQSLDNPVEIGVIYAFVTYLGRFAEPLIEITQRLNLYQQAIVAGERVFQLLDTEVKTISPDDNARITSGKVELDHIHFSYNEKQQVINDISLMIPAGKFHAIVGHTGSGKSTLTQLLLRFYQPQQGLIKIDDQPLNSFSETELRRAVGIVQQDPFIFNSSVRDNITLSEAIDEPTIIETAKQAGLHSHIERLPQGYNTILDERGSNLSTGQRQLLAMARALVHRPQILILDEATANIDSHTEAVIQQALMKLRGKVTLLVIAHRLSTIEKADEILVLHQGEVAQRGSHVALINQRGIYQHLYQMQTMELEDE